MNVKISRFPFHPLFHFRFVSSVTSISRRMMNIRHFNALKDNYMYLITDEKTRQCAVVDPAEPDAVVNIIETLLSR